MPPDKAKVQIDAVPQNDIWNGAWLVSNEPTSLDIWQQAKHVGNNLSMSLGTLLDAVFDIKQGDVNATYLNPLRLTPHSGPFTAGDVAVYKGEEVNPFAPLPTPLNWASPLPPNQKAGPKTIAASQALRTLQSLQGAEIGIVLRQVARLNTRERLTATWFERNATAPLAFTNELWRCKLKPGGSEQTGKALLALINR